MDGRFLSRPILLDNGGKGQRDKKRWDQNSKGTKSRGFLGAQQAAGDEKTGARGRSAREAH